MILSTPSEIRQACRSSNFTSQTSGIANGFAQANLCILPKDRAFDFLLFCQRNPKPCPLIEVLEPGQFSFGNDIDIRTDLPKYRVFRDGVFCEEVTDIADYWREDFVTFVIGCSFSFEEAMIRAGLSVRHVEESCNVPMYNTNIPCKPAGCFQGNMVVSMRPLIAKDVIKAVEITSRYPRVHGSPIHIGDPSSIGIHDINMPDYGDAVSIKPGEIPVFWACGVTPQAVCMASRPEICITHSPGHMLILDIRNDELSLN